MPPRRKFYKTQWAWQGVKLSRLISIFTSNNVWKFLIKIQLTKSNPKIIREVNSPCLMLIRVNTILPKPSQPSPLYSNHNVSVDAAADCFLYHRVAGYLLPFLLYFLFLGIETQGDQWIGREPRARQGHAHKQWVPNLICSCIWIFHRLLWFHEVFSIIHC